MLLVKLVTEGGLQPGDEMTYVVCANAWLASVVTPACGPYRHHVRACRRWRHVSVVLLLHSARRSTRPAQHPPLV